MVLYQQRNCIRSSLKDFKKMIYSMRAASKASEIGLPRACKGYCSFGYALTSAVSFLWSLEPGLSTSRTMCVMPAL